LAYTFITDLSCTNTSKDWNCWK